MDAPGLKETAARGAFEWAKGQPYQNVISTVLVLAVIAGLWKGGPYLIGEMKDLYTRQEASHREERKERDERYLKAIGELRRTRSDDDGT